MKMSELRSRRALESLEARRLEVGRLRRNLKAQESRCTRTTAKYGSVGGRGTGERAAAWDELADRRMALEEQEKQLQTMEKQLDGWIGLLPKPRWQAVLRSRYIDGLNFSEVLEELEKGTGRPFSQAQIYNLHRQALLAAERLWPMS